MSTSYYRGHPVYYDWAEPGWKFVDNQKLVVTEEDRPCKRCGQPPTKEGHDVCLGEISGITSACCGHGVREGFQI